MGLMFIAYDLRRIGNILTWNVLKEYPGVLVSSLLAIFELTEAVLRHFGASGVTMAEFAGGMYCNPQIPGRNRKTGKNWLVSIK